MDEVKGLARLVKWEMRGSRCDIFRCNKPAEYMLRHKQGMFSGTDSHFLLCGDCAEAVLRELPEELEELKAFASRPLHAVEMVKALTESPEIQALARGEDVADEVRQALGSLLDLLAESGAEVTVDEPAPQLVEGPKPVDTDIYCQVCGKGPFKTKNALTGHMASHRSRK